METHAYTSKIILILQFLVQSAKCDLTCLACPDSPAARDCPSVTRCGQHESCYLDSYVTTTGSVIHNMGCRDVTMCTPITGKRSANRTLEKRSSGNLLVCSECCNGDLCNSALCGQIGYPTVSGSRGPVCYNCDQQSSPASCSVITECGRDEVCSLIITRSAVVTSDILYSTGCKSRHKCEADLEGLRQAYGTIIGRKRYNYQAGQWMGTCCDDDVCNSNILGCRNPSYVRVPSTGVCLRVDTSHFTYDHARNSCRQDGGDLVTIKTQTALQAVSEVLASLGASNYWVGLRRSISSPSHFDWVDDSRLAVSSFQFWKPGQPDNLNGTQGCGLLLKRADNITFQLADYNCKRHMRYICEMKL